MYVYTYMYVCMYACMYVCTYNVLMYVCTCIYMYMYHIQICLYYQEQLKKFCSKYLVGGICKVLKRAHE